MFSAIGAASPHSRLTLNAVHHLNHDTHQVKPRKTRFPDNVDVVLASHLVFTLSGVLNGAKVSSSDVLKSQLAQHLVDYFQANAAELGIAPVSSMYLGDDGLPKLRIISSRCLTPESELHRVHVTLVRVDLNYVWHTSANSTSLVHPFSTHLSLPFQLLLDNVISRFFTWHLVRRYPLIFGRWCQQLDVERPYFDKIFRSISNIIARSPNPSFRKKCTRMLATIQDQQSANFTAATSSLATYFGAPYEDFDEPALTDQEAFSLSMEIRYRTCLRRPQFKGTGSAAHADDASDDEDLSQDMSLLTPDSSQRFDETFLWQGAPVSTTFDDLSPTLDGADLGFGFDLPLCLASPVANIECCPVLDMGMEIEYQDPSEVWSDIDIDGTDDNDLLNLSSDDEALFRPQPWDTHNVTPARYYPTRDLRLLDVNTNDASHADESPDALWHPLCPSLSPPEGHAGSSARQGAAGPYFPGLSMNGVGLDLDLSFDSDYSDSPSGSDEHTLEDFADVISPIRDTCAVPEEELEHQTGNGSKCTEPETEDGADEMDGEDDIGLLDEDW